MFLVAGISARFSLQKRTARQFIKERAQKLLIPFFGAMFLLGWICGWVNNQYVDMFAGNNVPVIVKYIVYCFAGNGPLWFLLELFLVSMVLLILRKIEKND
jgi:fucose 4-O-acetylase-like acetyltransferase